MPQNEILPDVYKVTLKTFSIDFASTLPSHYKSTQKVKHTIDDDDLLNLLSKPISLKVPYFSHRVSQFSVNLRLEFYVLNSTMYTW